ncbi:MAG TPA: DUF748 domain-containing protein [Acidobacteriota bacterium]|nr:DUF748 domain-containing protein [Acidobacteriota bacterium]
MSPKLIKHGLIVLAGILVIAGVFLWLSLSALTRELAQETVPGLTIGEVTLAWNRVDLTDFSYTSTDSPVLSVNAPSVKARPTFFSFLGEEIEVADLDIDGGRFRLTRKANPTDQPPKRDLASAATGTRIDFKEIHLEGEGEITDETVVGPPARFVLDDLYVRVTRLKYPIAAGATAIDASCTIKGTPDGRAQVTGWIDPVNQSAELQVVSTDIDLKTLRPYLKKRVSSLENADGTASLHIDLSMANGVYDAEGEVVLAGLHMGEAGSERPGLPKLLLTQYLKLSGNSVTIPFRITGDLKNQKHRIDFGALLSGVLNKELGPEALQKKLGVRRDLEDLDQDLRRLQDKAKELKDLF